MCFLFIFQSSLCLVTVSIPQQSCKREYYVRQQYQWELGDLIAMRLNLYVSYALTPDMDIVCRNEAGVFFSLHINFGGGLKRSMSAKPLG